MQLFLRVTFGLFLLCGVTSLWGTHIVGAELYYTCLDSATDEYEITLKIYRDCDRGQANFDDPIDLFIFDGATGNRLQILSIPKPANTPKIAPEQWGDCVGTTYNICVEEGIYRDTLRLPGRIGGYDLAWARCCRNSAITNLANPLGEGVTFLAHIPGSTIVSCNSMPTFNQIPPVFLCTNQRFAFDHSAFDFDGDSLVYRFTDPYRGLDLNGAGAGNNQQTPGAPPPIVSLANPMGPPPYQTVGFRPGYIFTNPFGPGPCTIDRQTGFLDVTPQQPGIFVISISVFEYRNGQLLSEQRRDFQIHVVNCLPKGSPPVITHDLSGLPHSGDTICIIADTSFCYPVLVTDPDTADGLRAFAVSSQFNKGASFFWSGSNPIRGFVCWEPGCEHVGGISELIVAARDTGDCPNAITVFDTVWVKVLPPKNKPPEIRINLNGLTLVADTICVLAEDYLCIPYIVLDSNSYDTLRITAYSDVFRDPNSPTLEINGVNPLFGKLCWTPSCDYEDQVIRIILEAVDRPECVAPMTDRDTIYIKVKVPPNRPPVIATDLTGNTFVGDTILIEALDSLCFSFTITDPDAGDSLTAFPVSPIFQQPDGPEFSFSGKNPVQGTICWTPSCVYDGLTIPLIFGGVDDARCEKDREVRDTVWVKISSPPNQAPLGWHDLSLLPSVLGDTIFIDATDAFCYPVSFNDPDLGDSLTLTLVGAIFDTAANPPVVDVRGTNPLSIDVCWTPGCEYEGMLIPIILRAEDNGKCNKRLHTLDTVWVKINESRSLPPRIQIDLGSLNSLADTIYMWVEDSICYDVTIFDNTPKNGLQTSYRFESANGGNNLGYGSWSFRRRGDSIVGRVCIKAPCALGGGLYRMKLTALDMPKCPPNAEAERIIYLRVQTPFLAFAGQDTFFCQGEGGVRLAAIPLGGVPPYDFLWTCDNPPFCGLSSPYDSIPTANPSGTTTYSVQITDSKGCKSEVDGVEIEMRAKPIVDAGPDQSICEGSAGIILRPTIVNSGASPGPYTYDWSPGKGLTDSTVLNPIAKPDQTTIYTLIVDDLTTGCSSYSTTLDPLSTTIVSVKKRPIVDAGPDRIICPRDSVPLLGKATGAPLPYRYQWSPSAGVDIPQSAIPTVSPPFTYIYTLVAWSAENCPSVADSVTVEVRTMPTADAGNSFEICEGESLRMRGLAGGDSTATYTYDWSPGFYLDDSTAQHPLATPEKAVQYSVVATSSHGCVSLPYVVDLRLSPRPIGMASAQAPWICEGDSLTLQVSYQWGNVRPNEGEPYVTWAPSNQMDDRNAVRPRVAPSSTVVYTLSTTFKACSSEDSVIVEVYPKPQVKLSASEAVICGRDKVQLFVDGGQGDALYRWNTAPGLSDPSISNPWVSPAQSQSYVVTVQEGACKTTDSIFIPVYYRPEAIIDHTALKGCTPFEVSLSARADSALYIWQRPGHPIVNTKDIALQFDTPGEYKLSLIVIGEGGCADTSKTETVRVFSPPEAGFITNIPLQKEMSLPLEVQFIDMSERATHWLWDFGNGDLSTDPTPSYSFMNEGLQQVILTVQDDFGCMDTASFGPFLLKKPSWIIPNVFTPNGDELNDRFGVQYDGDKPLTMQVFDRYGLLMYEGPATLPVGWDGLLPNGRSAAAGTYYYSISIEGKILTGWVALLR